MAYPFAPAVPWNEFIRRLKDEFDVKWTHAKTKVILAGRVITPDILERQVDEKILCCPISNQAANSDVEWTTIRYVCRHLQIDPAAFGLDIG